MPSVDDVAVSSMVDDVARSLMGRASVAPSGKLGVSPIRFDCSFRPPALSLLPLSSSVDRAGDSHSPLLGFDR